MVDESDKKTEESSEPARKGGKSDRSAQAKAFYRAMYAGAEPDPEEFGMSVKEQGGSGSSGPCGTCSRLQADMEDLERRTQEAENHYKRMAADFENYRKRVAREREEFSAAGIQRAIEAILPALDDMDLAKTKLSKDMDSANMMESLNMVYNRFNRCLEQIGIKQLECIGEMFDPQFHEPVQQIPTNAVPDGAVFQQLRPGYLFNDKVLRPSLVNVATATEYSDEEHAQADVAQGAEQPAEEQYEQQEEASPQEEWSDEAEEGGEGARTQDLPIVDVTADLHAQVFEDKEEEEAESANSEE